MRSALLILVFAIGCAVGTIHRPDGTTISGIAVGAARLESCERDGALAQSSGSADGAMVGSCARLSGGSVSTAFAGMVGAAISAAVLYFSGGTAF